MIERFCYICNNPLHFLVKKRITDYLQCESCRTVFAGEEISNENLVDGFHSDVRRTQNHIRIDRMDTMTEGMNKEDVFILDYGCGSGYLVEDLRAAGYINTYGFDLYNPKYSRLPERNKYHIITCVECIEHCCFPYLEIDVMHRSLKENGAVYYETGFIDIAKEEGVPLNEYIYISDVAAHNTVFSHHSLDLLMCSKSFMPRRHFDRNTRCYLKINK